MCAQCLYLNFVGAFEIFGEPLNPVFNLASGSSYLCHAMAFPISICIWITGALCRAKGSKEGVLFSLEAIYKDPIGKRIISAIKLNG